MTTDTPTARSAVGVDVRLLNRSGEERGPLGAQDSLREAFEGLAQGLNGVVVEASGGEGLRVPE